MPMDESKEDPHKLGNLAVKQGNFIEAMVHYTKAVKIDPKNHLLYSNRSMAFLKASQFYHAHQDAKECIKLQPQWAKGYFRRGEVEFATEHFSEAIVSYRNAMIHSPEDTKIREAMHKSQTELKKQIKNEDRIIPYGIAGGILLGAIVVGADEIFAKSPTLNFFLLKALVLLAIIGISYGAALAYKSLIQSQRNGLLDPPIDLYPELAEEQSSAPQEEVTSHKRRQSGAAAGKQKYKKGKS